MKAFNFVHQYCTTRLMEWITRLEDTKTQFLGFGHTWLLYINGISHDQKPIVKISGDSKFPGGILPGTMPGIITETDYFRIQIDNFRKILYDFFYLNRTKTWRFPLNAQHTAYASLWHNFDSNWKEFALTLDVCKKCYLRHKHALTKEVHERHDGRLWNTDYSLALSSGD